MARKSFFHPRVAGPFALAGLALWLVLALASAAWGGVSTAWVRHYNGAGNGNDAPNAMALDSAGNIYVAGYALGASSSHDYVIIKYNPAGTRQWVRRYNGPGNSVDTANAMAVDSANNIYVTGRSVGSGTGADFATIKYNAAGDRLWVQRWNGPEDGYDEAKAITLDTAGNIYVTGRSHYSLATGDDFVTIKYNSAGTRLWVQRYNGPGDDYDHPSAIAVDSAGNVFVTGPSIGAHGNYDYAVVKYDTGGTRLWARRYNGPGDGGDIPRALAVDGLGNVYVTGKSQNSSLFETYATVKYSPDGTRLWVRGYNPGGYGAGAHAIAIDGLGNVYVTGASKRSSALSFDYATIKYNPSGDRLWVRRFNGPGNGFDGGLAAALDSLNNVYVTGYSAGSGTGYDFATIKYGSAGTWLWGRRYNNRSVNGDDQGVAIAVDGLGNVYVTGTSMRANEDIIIIKYTETP